MLRGLLAERFMFRAHNESRELPVYALVKARADGRLGSELVEQLRGIITDRLVIDQTGLAGKFDRSSSG